MPSAPRRASVLGFPVDAVTLEEALDLADAFIRARKPARIGAVNAAKLIGMQRDPALGRAVGGCELVLPDGIGVVWAAALLGRGLIRRVPGIDVMERLVALAAEKGYGVYFLGARDEVLETMIRRLRARHPALRVAGSHNGYFRPEEEPDIVETVRASGADILFVGMGTPAKEFWIDRNFRTVGVPLSMGVGGSFDVISGHVKRAPGWMQGAGLEWFFRFLQEPRRMWRRYFVTSAVFMAKVVWFAVRRPFVRRGPA